MSTKTLKRPPRQARAEASLDALTEAVEKLLRDKPFNDVSVAELAAEAGVSPAYLYTRFENKQALLDYVVSGFLAEQNERAGDLLAPERWRGVGLETRLARLANQFVAAARKHRGKMRALSEMAVSDETCEAGEAWLKAAAGGQLRDWLLECRDEIHHPDPQNAVVFVLQMFALGLQSSHLLSPAHPAREVSTSELVHMALTYLTSDKPAADLDTEELGS